MNTPIIQLFRNTGKEAPVATGNKDGQNCKDEDCDTASGCACV